MHIQVISDAFNLFKGMPLKTLKSVFYFPYLLAKYLDSVNRRINLRGPLSTEQHILGKNLHIILTRLNGSRFLGCKSFI